MERDLTERVHKEKKRQIIFYGFNTLKGPHPNSFEFRA